MEKFKLDMKPVQLDYGSLKPEEIKLRFKVKVECEADAKVTEEIIAFFNGLASKSKKNQGSEPK
jgi:uncharacterized protein (UPF0548 family)